MSDMGDFFDRLLLYCLQNAGALPSPEQPLAEETEQEVDEWTRRLAQTGIFQAPPRRLLGALIPRLQFARAFGSLVQHRYELMAECGDAAATEAAMLRLLLIELWYEQGKALWLSGKLKLS